MNIHSERAQSGACDRQPFLHYPRRQADLLVLLQQLLENETTRAALLALLFDLFDDAGLAHKVRRRNRGCTARLAGPWCRTRIPSSRQVGTFLLAALDTDEARAMLNAQTAALVSATVLDRQAPQRTVERSGLVTDFSGGP